ncbi:Ig-like domain-containing protein, partial [Curtobacterium citreum]
VTTAADIVFTVRHAVAPVAPFAVTGPTEGSTVTSKRPVFTGTGAEGALIVVKGTSRQVASAVVEDGTWSVPADFDLGNSTYRLTVVQTPTGGGASAEKTVNFTVRAR